jgi:hypothetical protein
VAYCILHLLDPMVWSIVLPMAVVGIMNERVDYDDLYNWLKSGFLASKQPAYSTHRGIVFYCHTCVLYILFNVGSHSLKSSPSRPKLQYSGKVASGS